MSLLIRGTAYHTKQLSGKQTPSRTSSSDQKNRNPSPSSNSKPQSKQRAISQQAQRDKYLNPNHSGTKYDSINESTNATVHNTSSYMHQASRHSNNYSFEVSAERSRSSHHKERPQLNTTVNYGDQRVKYHQRNTPTEGKVIYMKQQQQPLHQNGNAKRANSTKKY